MLRRLAAGVALVAALALAGCTPPEPTESTTPVATPSTDTPATSDPNARLLADAVRVAEQFLAMTDAGFATGELPVEQLRTIASASLVTQLEAEVASFALQGFTVQGASRLDTPSLVDVVAPPQPGQPFELLACIDTSGVRTTDQQGELVSGGVERQPRIFEFVEDGSLVIQATTPPTAGTELPGCGS